MRIPCAIVLLLLAAAGGAEIIDGVAAVVGRQVITFSDLRRQTRLEAFFAGRPAPAAASISAEGRSALERLIEWRLVRQEMDLIDFPAASDDDARLWLQRLDTGGADPARYSLRPQDLVEFARRQVDLNRFVEMRFKAAAHVTPGQIEAYYKNTLVPELKRKGVTPIPTLEEASRSIEEILREERANQLLDEWVIEQRTHVRIQIMEPATP